MISSFTSDVSFIITVVGIARGSGGGDMFLTGNGTRSRWENIMWRSKSSSDNGCDLWSSSREQENFNLSLELSP